MLFVGIDPGKQGAVSIIDGDKLTVYDLKSFYDDGGASQTSINPQLFNKWVQQTFPTRIRKTVKVSCEKPIFVGGGFTIKTPMSMFESYGILRSVFTVNGIEFSGVKPLEWMRFYPDLYHPGKKRSKQESVDKAKELFPDYAGLFEKEVLKGKHKGNSIIYDGRAESSLIAARLQELVVGVGVGGCTEQITSYNTTKPKQKKKQNKKKQTKGRNDD